MPTIQTGRRNDLLKLDVVDLHRVQALCASKVVSNVRIDLWHLNVDQSDEIEVLH